MRRRRRRGAAMVEFALCLPPLMVFCFGTIEACSMIYLKQSLAIAAYEGARRANEPGATAASVTTDCEQIFSDRRIAGGTVSITPANLASVSPGDYYVVECIAPSNANSLMPPWFSVGQDMVGRAEFMKK